MALPDQLTHDTPRGTTPERFGGAVPMTNLDVVLATVIALGFPFAARWLFDVTGGALASLLLYYGVSGVLVVRWRKGTLDYGRPVRWPWGLFGAGLVLTLAITARNWGAFAAPPAPLVGVLLTAFVWAPLNAALEHLSWLYVLDAWRNHWQTPPLRWLGTLVGSLLLLAFVTLIHIVFWAAFLPEGQPTPWSWAVVPLNTLLTVVYVLLYYRARSFWPTLVIHLLVDLQLVLVARYSILPAL